MSTRTAQAYGLALLLAGVTAILFPSFGAMPQQQPLQDIAKLDSPKVGQFVGCPCISMDMTDSLWLEYMQSENDNDAERIAMRNEYIFRRLSCPATCVAFLRFISAQSEEMRGRFYDEWRMPVTNNINIQCCLKNISQAPVASGIKGYLLNFPPKGYTGAFMMYDDADTVDLYDAPVGQIISRIANNIEMEDFVDFELMDKTDSMFYVRVASDRYPERYGWIKRSTPIYVYSRNYNSDFFIYSYPNEHSETAYTQSEYYNKELRVVDFQGGWLKVIVSVGDTTYTGWLSPLMQCANIYTTCN